MTGKNRWRAACVAAVLAAAGAASAQTDIAALAQRAGPEREAALVQGARKEGEVDVYTSLIADDIAAVAAAFEKKYGVKVKYWRASSEKILQRTLAETRSGRFDVDVVETNGPELEALSREKVFVPAKSAHEADLLPQAIRPDRRWTGERLNMFVQAYNTKLVKRSDLPRTYHDLLDPKWKGKLGMEAEDFDWFAAVVRDMGESQGLAFFRDLASVNGLSVRKGHTLLAGLVASGEIPMALTLYNHSSERLKQKGAPIEWFQIQPGYARVNGIAVAAKSPHPHAALLFFDFVLGPEGQAILEKGGYIPTNLKLRNPNTHAGIRFIDPAIELNDPGKWEKYFDDIITRQPRR